MGDRETGNRRDRLQHQRRRLLFGLPVAIPALLWLILPSIWRMANGEATSRDWMFPVVFALVAWMAPVALMGWDGQSRRDRKYLEDELTQALRGRATALGFIVLLAGLTGVYLLGLWSPAWAMVAMPVVLITGALAPGIRFALLDREADACD